MTRERRTPACKIGVWLGACFSFLVVGVVWGTSPVTRLDAEPVLAGGTKPVVRAVHDRVQLLSCETDADCDDGNACTVDTCSDGVCSNTPIPECVPCEPAYACPPLDAVFVMDTSGSMKDEAAALCWAIDQIIVELGALGVEVDATILGITETPGGTFSCLTSDVVTLLGDTVPGDPTGCAFPDGTSPFESWGPATAIVAQRFPWSADESAVHIVIPIADEGPCNGSRPDSCNDPGDDRDSITNAIAVALANGVIVSPITGTGSDECVTALAGDLAASTGGTTFETQDAGADLPTAVVNILLESCEVDYGCDDSDACTTDDTCVEGRCVGGPPLDCDDDNVCTDDYCFPTMGCFYLNNTNPCDDQDICTTIDNCFGGECIGSAPLDCNDDNVCTDDLCDPESGCAWVNNTDPCDDENICTTDDACLEGECQGGAPLDCDDDNTCTDDSCDPESGCVWGNNTDPCDDGLFCTIDDMCADGTCTGGPPRDCSFLDDPGQCIVGVCNEEEDVCEPQAGNCPGLCLEPVEGQFFATGCYRADEEVVVNVVLYPSEPPESSPIISGGQFFIEYDPTIFEVVEVVCGADVDPDSPFEKELFEIISEPEGTVFYAVGIDPFGGMGTHGPAVMASIRFRPLVPCGNSGPTCYHLNENPKSTRLADVSGFVVPHSPCCIDNLVINSAEPVLACPGSVAVDADAGGVTALITWDPVALDEECGAGLEISCTAENSFGVNIDHLIEAGGVFPAGLSQFECSVSSECGVVDSCGWDVNVSSANLMEVDVQLSPTMWDGPLDRCIALEFYTNCTEPPIEFETTVKFGLPYNLPGHADHVTFKLPAGRYECVTARDPLHTLRSTAYPEVVDRKYVATFKDDPIHGGNWLIGGNLNGDGMIDVLDEGICVAQYASVVDANTPCGTEGEHADINGDGEVDALDLSFIQQNFGITDNDSCCPGGSAAGGAPPITEISIRELEQMGLGHLDRADLNGDGVLNQDDIDAFLQGQRPTKNARRLRDRDGR